MDKSRKQRQTQHAFPPKLTAPTTEGAYSRVRLFERLDSCLADARLVWIGAEAGSGKTTLAASYLHAYRKKALWYQIDEGDADLATFFYYMGEGARELAPHQASLPLLTPEYLDAVGVFARNFFRELFSRFGGEPGVLVLDNYHELPADASLHTLLVSACEELPPHTNILVLSRELPPASFARLYANANATTIEAAELRLTLEETEKISTLFTAVPIDKEVITSLHHQTGGWVAGLRLMLSQTQPASSGLHMESMQPPRLIFDYFAAEIFQRTDPTTQDFLLRSALLPTMISDAVCELADNPRGDDILRDLVRHNYFTVCHGKRVPVYEYHSLFRSFLLSEGRRRFSRAEYHDLIRRAVAVLLKSGQVGHAADLLREIGDNDALVELIERQAPALAAQGRLGTLESWLHALPVGWISTRPWLAYWLGYCRMPFDLVEARSLFEQAYGLFQQNGHPQGRYLAWAGIAETFQYGWDDFSGLDPWVEELRVLQKDYPLEQFPEAGPRVICAALGALSFARSDLPEVRHLANRAEALLDELRGSSMHIVIASTLHLYYGWIGDLAMLRQMRWELEQHVDASDLEPLARLYGHLALSETGWLIGDLAMVREWGERGIEYGERHGITMLKPLFHAQIDYVCQLDNDPEGARKQIEQLRRCTRPERRLDQSHYYYHATWLALEQGELIAARNYISQALDLTERLQARFPIALSRIKMAEVLAASGEYEAIPDLLDQVEDFARRMESPLLRFMAGLMRAFALLRAGRDDESAEVLAAALAIGHHHGYTTYSNWQGRHIAELCRLALERDIENDYVRELIRQRGLCPPLDSPVPDSWPFPIKIYTLGRFEVIRNETPLQFTGKAQKKPLELLKALIALGGQNVSTMNLGEILWPDAEGDVAQQNLKATLHRLRKLIGHDAILLQDNHMGLNPELCWTDIGALQHRIKQLAQPGTVDPLQVLAKLLEIYRGPFLANEEAGWVIVPREMLHGRFFQAVRRIAAELRRQGDIQPALRTYYRLLELEPLQEDLYMELMQCYKALGQAQDAAQVYRQLRNILGNQFGREPSADIEVLYREIVSEKS